MRMLTVRRPSLLAIVGISVVAVALSGCPAKEPGKVPASKEGEKVPAAAKTPTGSAGKEVAGGVVPSRRKTRDKTESAEEKISEAIKEAASKPRDLGPPLVTDVADLKRLHPEQPVWIDMKHKQVVLQGEVCAADYPLEFFATYPNRSYEAVLSVNVRPFLVHTGLLAVGAEPGHPVAFQPKFSPPAGTEVAIEVRWKDANGKVQHAPAQHWIRNIKTKKALDTNWVFAGSILGTDESGNPTYQADSGELICLLNLSSAMLDLPIRSESAMESRIFEAFTEHLPPQGTATTIVLTPILKTKPVAPPTPPAPTVKEAPITKAALEDAEKKAVAAADAWLALVDRGDLSQAWENSAVLLKDVVQRRDFVKSVGDVRKPLGKVKTRQLDSKKYTTALPNAPAGQYVVLQYKVSFANGKTAIETITPMLGKDKKWRVSGYYVK